MHDTAIDINEKNSINLSRNTPVSLVVGAAGFLGSHLVDKLLEKNIQVIGVDNFSTGKRRNLNEAVKNKKFHLLTTSAEKLELDVPRLDYVFLLTGGDWKVDSLLQICKRYGSRVVLVSYIDLYDSKESNREGWFKETEKRLAKFAQENKLNARVVRLATVYGPRMHFRHDDAVVNLLRAALEDKLQKESDVMEFSTRALYIFDATSLIIKSMLAGSTALKIYDGALYFPIKASELKQILLDPLWYENKGFNPTELPPWPTPNLEKTMKELNWQPKYDLIKGLKDTLSFFKDNEIRLEEKVIAEEEKNPLADKPRFDMSLMTQPERLKENKGERGRQRKAGWPEDIMVWFSRGAIIAVVFYALIYPAMVLGIGAFTLRYQLSQSFNFLSEGDFNKSLASILIAKNAAARATEMVDWLKPVSRAGLFSDLISTLEDLAIAVKLVTEAAEHTVIGTQTLTDGLKAITGEITDEPAGLLNKAYEEFALADQKFSKAMLLMSQDKFNGNLPLSFDLRLKDLKNKLAAYLSLVQKGRAVIAVLSDISSGEGKKSYLVLLLQNSELRPGGGVISSFAQVDFEGGKLKGLEVDDSSSVDSKLGINVEPPLEIKNDLASKWYLRDSNWEPDFPSSARQAEWFYNQESGVRVEGVIALDATALGGILEVLGPLDVPGVVDKVSTENLMEKVVLSSQDAKEKSFLTNLTLKIFNRLLFVPNQNWPKIAIALSDAVEKKHLMVYFTKPKLFSYVLIQNWSAAFLRPDEGDFLAPVEANVGLNQANYFLKREYKLETVIGKEGIVSHKFKVIYTNESPSPVFPGGKYKNRLRIFVPSGSKLDRVLWGETEVTRLIETFSDYGKTGYSILLEVEPKQTKQLTIEYQIPLKVEFKDGRGLYRLDVIKQPGTIRDPFEFKLSYPLSLRIVNVNQEKYAPQEYVISSDLSIDRRFELTFVKN